MTLEAWIRPTTLASWNTVVFKDQPSYYAYALYANTGTNRPSGNVYNSDDRDLRGSAQLATGTWTHLATTYDGNVLALYVNGVQNATLLTSGPIVTSTGQLRIGNNTIWGEPFNGLIDEVRVYNRALTATDIQTDMNRPITNPDSTPPTAPTNFTRTGGSATTIATSWTASTDNVAVNEYWLYRNGVQAGTSPTTTFTFTGLTCGTSSNLEVEARDAAGNASPRASLTASTDGCDVTPPSAPGTLTASGSTGQASLSWGAASDNVGVVRYNVHRGTTSGFTPSAANRIAQPTGTSYADTTTPGTYFYVVTAEDAAGNVGAASNQASATVTGDTIAPTAPSALNASGGSQVALSWTAATDNVGVVRYNVHRGTSAGFTLSAANRIAQPTGTSFTNTGLAAGTYYYRVTAEDAAGNVGPASNEANATVSTSPPTGLVAGYGFDEGSGTGTADGSGRGNGGTVSGATWTTGKFGSGLNFDGVNDWVTIADSASLDLTTAMTLEAWVLPAVSSNWRTAVFKEQTGDVAYSLYSSINTNVPRSEAVIGGAARSVNGTAALTSGVWSHLSATYDGSTYRLFVNGAQVASTAATGNIAVSSGALRIGGNNVWGEWFSGRIDEVRVYNRALTQAELQTDMNRPVTPDFTAPTIVSLTPTDGSTNAGVDTKPTVRFSELIDASTLSGGGYELRDSSNVVVPATITYDDLTQTATLAPTSALTYGAATYTVRVKGGPTGVRDYSGNALAADRVWTFTTEAIPPPILVISSTANKFTLYATEILRAEGLNEFASLDVSLISPAALGHYYRRDPRRHLADADPGDDVDQLGQRRRKPDRPEPRQAARRSARPHGRRDDAFERISRRQHRNRGRGGHRRADDPVPRHGRPVHAERRDLARNALLERDDGDVEPGGDAPFCRVERRPGGGVHVRPQPLGRVHEAGQPRLGGPEPRRGRRPPLQRPLLRRCGRRPAAGLARHQQDRDPSGRRAAASAREPGHAHEPRQVAPAPVLVPAARREGRARDDGRRPRLRRHRRQVRHLPRRQRTRLLRSELGLRALDLLHLHEQPAHEHTSGRLHGPGLRGRAPCQHRRELPGVAARRAGQRLLHAAAERLRREVHVRPRARHQPDALRRVGGLGDAAEGRARSRDPARHELLPLPRELDRQQAGLHDRLRHDHALRGRRRHR